ARIRFLMVLRPMTNDPHLRDRVQKCVKPRKSNVSGFPSPRLSRCLAAWRPKRINRVLSGCNANSNARILSCRSCRKAFASCSCSNPTIGRVAERDLTSPPSQNRTGRSRVIRLLPPSLRSHALFPQDKQFGVPSRDASQPVHRRAFSAFEPLKLPSRPLSEGLVEWPEHLNALQA